MDPNINEPNTSGVFALGEPVVRVIVPAADQPNAENNIAIMDDGKCCSIELI